MNYSTSLNICEFFSVCSQLIYHSGNIIHETFDPNNLLVKIKNGQEPYTEADVKVQTFIVQGLKSVWPNLRIIAEEEEVYKGEFPIGFSDLKTDLVQEGLFRKIESVEINIEDAIVWIDPLDGTAEFVQGCLESVTTLVGISVKGESKIGVIGKYFRRASCGSYVWEPKCYFAHADNPHLYYFDYEKPDEVKELCPQKIIDDEGLSICTTKSTKALQDFQKTLLKINPNEICRVGGAGNKVIHVLEGNSHCYFFPKSGMKKWDICAGEALIKSMGGIVTDSANKVIEYKEEKCTWTCQKGVIASISSEKHDRVTRAL